MIIPNHFLTLAVLLCLLLPHITEAQCPSVRYDFDGDASASVPLFDGIPKSSPSYTDDRDGNPDSAIKLDGIDDCIRLPRDFDFPERTVNLWFRVDSVDAVEQRSQIFNSDNPSQNWGNTLLAAVTYSGLLELGFRAGGVVLDLPIQYDTWYMATITRNPGLTRFYLDGVMVFEAPSGTLSSVSGVKPAKFGCGRNVLLYFNGAIDDAMLMRCALSPSEVGALFTTAAPRFEKPELEEELTIFPNPASDLLYIDLSKQESVTNYTVLDMTGRTVMAGNSAEQTELLQINVADLPAGYYLFNLFSEEGLLKGREKFVVR